MSQTTNTLSHLRSSLAAISCGDAGLELQTENQVDRALKVLSNAINGTDPYGESNRSLAMGGRSMLELARRYHPTDTRIAQALEVANAFISLAPPTAKHQAQPTTLQGKSPYFVR